MTQAPQRNAMHDALAAFLGKWTAHGTSYGGTDQTGRDPKANGETWMSTHEASWHTGRFFVVQDERADIAGNRFDTLSILGVNDDGSYFSRSVENHGFYRNYTVTHEGDRWQFDGPKERATVTFENDGKRQVWKWEWKSNDTWLPLCDRVADRVD
jgi:hypothetical protein